MERGRAFGEFEAGGQIELCRKPSDWKLGDLNNSCVASRDSARRFSRARDAGSPGSAKRVVSRTSSSPLSAQGTPIYAVPACLRMEEPKRSPAQRAAWETISPPILEKRLLRPSRKEILVIDANDVAGNAQHPSRNFPEPVRRGSQRRGCPTPRGGRGGARLPAPGHFREGFRRRAGQRGGAWEERPALPSREPVLDGSVRPGAAGRAEGEVETHDGRSFRVRP